MYVYTYMYTCMHYNARYMQMIYTHTHFPYCNSLLMIHILFGAAFGMAWTRGWNFSLRVKKQLHQVCLNMAFTDMKLQLMMGKMELTIHEMWGPYFQIILELDEDKIYKKPKETLVFAGKT